MLRPNSLMMTVNSISLNKRFFKRSEKVIARTPSIVVMFTSPSSNSRSLSFPSAGIVLSGSVPQPPKSLSFHDKDSVGSGSPPILILSSTISSLNLTFLEFRSLSEWETPSPLLPKSCKLESIFIIN
ncbi:hypothetical protein ES332_A13G136700v1 [Gossypium tomentosum]|uniref:Uncharacterized protein n=1 Tax=Gossypium tomentosum TaxID=34277 RepID=A0A5D2MKX7_GOSTO|nr:hypothetical protein ES332_A13G136700v1 [Gossypium tomentosum]